MAAVTQYTTGQRVILTVRGEQHAVAEVIEWADDGGECVANVEQYLRIRVISTTHALWAPGVYKLRRPDYCTHAGGWERRRKGRTVLNNIVVAPS